MELLKANAKKLLLDKRKDYTGASKLLLLHPTILLLRESRGWRGARYDLGAVCQEHVGRVVAGARRPCPRPPCPPWPALAGHRVPGLDRLEGGSQGEP